MSWLRRLIVMLAMFAGGCGQPSLAERRVIISPQRPSSEIEYFVAHPNGRGPWPTIVLLHGHQPAFSSIGGKSFVKWGELDRYAREGYLAISISLPGFGGSSGPADFAGPVTQQAVRAVIRKVEKDGLARPDRIVILGISLGAVTSALVTASDPHIAGQVLISGLYDLRPFFARPKSDAAEDVKSAIVAQTGGSDAALLARSALPVAKTIKAKTLLLNGAKDDRTDPDQASRMAAIIESQGVEARAHIFPDYGHEIPVDARRDEVGRFVDAILKR